mmetsp:Transcript_5157/g.21987  ORF Transcript_5157/g.21987 Transcript_5157/m.21987 type:complete len:236 (+) Transcript_5157:571-1278(+)
MESCAWVTRSAAEGTALESVRWNLAISIARDLDMSNCLWSVEEMSEVTPLEPWISFGLSPWPARMVSMAPVAASTREEADLMDAWSAWTSDWWPARAPVRAASEAEASASAACSWLSCDWSAARRWATSSAASWRCAAARRACTACASCWACERRCSATCTPMLDIATSRARIAASYCSAWISCATRAFSASCCCCTYASSGSSADMAWPETPAGRPGMLPMTPPTAPPGAPVGE